MSITDLIPGATYTIKTTDKGAPWKGDCTYVGPDDTGYYPAGTLQFTCADGMDAMVRIEEVEHLVSVPQGSIHALITTVETAHFRTVTDTGANPNAMVVWNALRRAAGLPSISKDDLPAWDGRAYVQPAESKLLARHAPVPLVIPSTDSSHFHP